MLLWYKAQCMVNNILSLKENMFLQGYFMFFLSFPHSLKKSLAKFQTDAECYTSEKNNNQHSSFFFLH